MISPLPEPPPLGWTIREAAAALLPDLYEAAARPIPEHWWMAGGEPHKAERDVLRLAFARLMEAGNFIADGIPLLSGETVAIPSHIWRAARFSLGMPQEPHVVGDLEASFRSWSGVRIKAAARPADGTVGEEARLRAWLAAEMQAALDNPTAKEAMQVRAKNAGLSFTGRAFERAWRDAVNETGARAWTLPGRKSTRQSPR